MEKQNVRIKPSRGISTDMIRLNDSLFESQVKNSSLAEAMRLDNIKFDSNNEARIIVRKFLNVHNSNFGTFSIERAKSDTISSSTERINTLLKKENKALSEDFPDFLSKTFDELKGMDVSKEELVRQISDNIYSYTKSL